MTVLDFTPEASTASAPTPSATARRSATPPRRGVRAGIFGIGAALPDQIVTNRDLESHLDTSDEWIMRRTGIRERRHLEPGGSLTELAARACIGALADAGRTAAEVDRVIASTLTPDRLTPGLAPCVAEAIGAHGASAVDVNAACAGFLYALDQAAALIESGRASVILVIGAEALTRITDREDRSTAVLFGDGAAAVVVAGGDLDMGCGSFVLGADGAQADLLFAERGDRLLQMQGAEVYRHAVRRMTEATAQAIADAGLTVDDIDLFVPHQANSRIIETAAAELGLPMERVVLVVDRFANTSSASIPLALWEAEREGRLRPGAKVAMAAFGAGFVWGAGVITWKEQVDVRA